MALYQLVDTEIRDEDTEDKETWLWEAESWLFQVLKNNPKPLPPPPTPQQAINLQDQSGRLQWAVGRHRGPP